MAMTHTHAKTSVGRQQTDGKTYGSQYLPSAAQTWLMTVKTLTYKDEARKRENKNELIHTGSLNWLCANALTMALNSDSVNSGTDIIADTRHSVRNSAIYTQTHTHTIIIKRHPYSISRFATVHFTDRQTETQTDRWDRRQVSKMSRLCTDSIINVCSRDPSIIIITL